MKKILFLTSMYPDPLRTDNTPVCHFYTKEWKRMGYQVIVINLRSMFPPFYTWTARLFPRLASMYIGNHVEMDRNMNTIKHYVDDILVYSIPVFKYIPHHRYPQASLKKTAKAIGKLMSDNNFIPDAIVGHFLNPAMELIHVLKKHFPEAKTSIVFHEADPSAVTKYYSKVYKEILSNYDLVGFRNKGMKNRYEAVMGSFPRTFICYSGTKDVYLQTPRKERVFEDGPIKRFVYVGQIVENKAVLEMIQGLHLAMGTDFHLTCIGQGNEYKDHVNQYIIDNHLEKCIEFTGQIPRDKIIEYYDNNDCFVMISRLEAFGLVYLEAMSRGCITIGSKGQGIDGVIINRENGFLCEGGNAEELSNIIMELNKTNSKTKADLSKRSIETAEKYSDPNVAKMYINEIEKLF